MSTKFEYKGREILSIGHGATPLFAAQLSALETHLGKKSGVSEIMGDTYLVDDRILNEFLILAQDAVEKCEHPLWRLLVTPALSVLIILAQKTGSEEAISSRWPYEIIEAGKTVGLEAD